MCQCWPKGKAFDLFRRDAFSCRRYPVCLSAKVLRFGVKRFRVLCSHNSPPSFKTTANGKLDGSSELSLTPPKNVAVLNINNKTAKVLCNSSHWRRQSVRIAYHKKRSKMSKQNGKVSLTSTGLSRNSTKSYQANILRSTAELNKTLRNLDREFNTNISKILNDRHELRNSEEVKRSESFPRRTRLEKYHYHGFTGIVDDGLSVEDDLSVDFELEESGFCFGSKDENETLQELSSKHYKPSNDKQICHLPSIVEETTRKTRQKLISAKSERTPLPPLHNAVLYQRVAAPDVDLNEVGSIPHRRVSESLADIGFSQRVSQESKDVTRHTGKSRRSRSLTLPVGYPHALLDKSLTKRGSKSSDVPSVDPRSDIDREHKHLHRSNSDSESKPAWDEDLMKCRYIRHRSCSSPDILDGEAIFGPHKVQDKVP